MSLVLEKNSWATVLVGCVEQANAIIDFEVGAGTMTRIFIRDVIVPLTYQFFDAKNKKYGHPPEQQSYDAANIWFEKLLAKHVKVLVGGISEDSPDDYAQADTGTVSIHLNLSWVDAAQNAFDVDPQSLESQRHRAVLIVKILHEYIHLYTRTLVTFYHSSTGVKTTKKVGRKILRDGTDMVDLGFAGEELMFTRCVQLSYQKHELFNAKNALVLTDTQQNAWSFGSEQACTEFTNRLIFGALTQDVNYGEFFRPGQNDLIRVLNSKKGKKRKKQPSASSRKSTLTKKSATSSSKKESSSEGSEPMPADEDSDSVSSDDIGWSWKHRPTAPKGNRKS